MSRGHLTEEERYQAHALREAGLSLRAIGKRMHRSASTICRELKRNRCPAGYSPDPAHTRSVRHGSGYLREIAQCSTQAGELYL